MGAHMARHQGALLGAAGATQRKFQNAFVVGGVRSFEGRVRASQQGDESRTLCSLHRKGDRVGGDMSDTPHTNTFAKRYAAWDLARELEDAIAALRVALTNCITVMDEAGRRAALKELTDAELGRLWLATVEQARAALTSTEQPPVHCKDIS